MPSSIRRRPRSVGSRSGQRGQAVVIFTIALVAIISVAGLLVDGGMAWANRRQAQAAADTGALAAAKVFSTTGSAAQAQTAAAALAAANGYPTSYTDCGGVSRTNGVVVNAPPLSGAYTNQAGYVEVIVTRPMRTSFAGAVGQPCWLVSARAVALSTSTGVATCNFCSLNNSNSNHTLVLKNGANLRVDGDIHANSHNGGYTPGVCLPLTQWKVCGDGFDVFGDGGSISAKHITVVGGWETHDENVVTADELAPGCVDSHDPPSQPVKPSNVCIHMPEIPDPFNDPAKPGARISAPQAGSAPVPGQNGCPATATAATGTVSRPAATKITGGNKTICPGTYYGGLQITGGTVTMAPGIYVMLGGGFQVLNSGSVDGRAGVMIYATGSVGAGHSTTTANDLVPPSNPSRLTLDKAELVSSDSTSDPGQAVTFTMTLTPKDTKGAVPGGYVDFYDGNVMICSAAPVVPPAKGNVVTATCATSYAFWGVRAISAVYSGDAVYNAAGDTLTQTVKAPSGISDGPITIDTSGRVDLFGPASGAYAGMTIFQDRSSNMTITLAPGNSNAGNCPGNFMWKGVPPDTTAPPEPCGDMGGLQGTIYAGHQNALVLIESSGMANLQVIAGEIEVNNDADSRFGFKSSVFANSSIHLVE